MNDVLRIVDALYSGESESKKNEVRSEAEAYLSRGVDNIFFSIADQALTRTIRENFDELMPDLLSLAVENVVGGLEFNHHIAEQVIAKAQRYLIDLDLTEGVDLGRSIRVLTSQDYRSAVVGIISENFETLIHLLQSRGISANEMYGQPALVSGQAYELFVSKILANLGCKTEITKGSGDQGADIIGMYRNHKFVVQCKFYSAAVGNKAVQEAHAAKTYYRADRAIVVSNTNYTKSASELADSLGISLLHHQELEKFIQYLDAFANG